VCLSAENFCVTKFNTKSSSSSIKEESYEIGFNYEAWPVGHQTLDISTESDV
jgi:hypothetical protein